MSDYYVTLLFICQGGPQFEWILFCFKGENTRFLFICFIIWKIGFIIKTVGSVKINFICLNFISEKKCAVLKQRRLCCTNQNLLIFPVQKHFFGNLQIQWWLEQQKQRFSVFIAIQWLGSFARLVVLINSNWTWPLTQSKRALAYRPAETFRVSFPSFLPLFKVLEKDPAVLSFNDLKVPVKSQHGQNLPHHTINHLRDGNNSHLAFTSHWAHNCRK